MKNKIKLLLAILFYTTVSNGQALDGYKYIILEPLKYQNGATDIWGISSKLRSYFLNKGFIVLGETVTLGLLKKFNLCICGDFVFGLWSLVFGG